MIWKNSDEGNSLLQKWWDMEHIPYGKGGDQKPLGEFLKNNKEYEELWHHFEERELNCYPSNYHPYDYIIHYMGNKSKINIKQLISNFNKLIKYENDEPKIYISIATIPSRFQGLNILVYNLINSNIKPTRIIFQIPEKYLLFPDSSNHIQKIQTELFNHINNDIVYINILKTDYGSCNKYQGMFQYYETHNLINENFVAVICDDDLLLHNFVIQDLINKYSENKRNLITPYHMSTIKINLDKKYNTFLLKGADSILIPKIFFYKKY